jgi:type I thyroxine 5'-deiodinase
VQFLVIYIREAHPVDGWWLGGGLSGMVLRLSGSKAAMDIYDPQTLLERRQVAAKCEASLAYDILTLVDDIDDPVNRAYAAHPTRLYLVGLDGRVRYAGGLGPFGFKPRELQDAIEDFFGGMNP